MLNIFKFRISCLAATALLLAITFVTGCAVSLPSPPSSNPADANASEAVAPPLQPTLLASSRTFLSPAADDREQAAKQMDMSKMNHGANGMGAMQRPMNEANPTPKPSSDEAYYTCVMHPQIHEAKPGQCPICGMTLVKKSGQAEGAKP